MSRNAPKLVIFASQTVQIVAYTAWRERDKALPQ